ncbi:MAG: TolC family protein [Bacteroidota bacterium]
MKKITITVLSIFLWGNIIHAQRTWSLEKCIRHVKQNNTSNMRRANLEVEKSKKLQERATAQKLPNLGFGTNLGLNTGRVIDPSTNDFLTSTLTYNNLSLEGNYTLFDGGQNNKRIAQSKLDIQAAEKDMEQLSQNLTLQVVRAYLQILMAEEQLTNAENNLKQTETWFRQTQNLVKTGLRSNSDLREVEIQKSIDEQNIITAQNLIDRSYIQLKQVLEIDPSLSFKIEKPKELPEPDEKIENLDFKKIYAKALKTQPGIEAGEFRLQSLKLEEDIAEATKKPSVSLFSGLYTNYSSGISDFTRPDTSGSFEIATPAEVILPGETEPSTLFFVSDSGIDYPAKNYFKQLGENVGFGVGVNVYVPIFDRKSSQINSELAKINYLQVQEDNLLFQQQLRTDIQNAIINVQAASETLKGAEKTFQLLEKSLVFTKNKLDLGNINTFQYTTQLNEKDRAQIELVIAKYDFLMKKMIVEFYEGKKLSLE